MAAMNHLRRRPGMASSALLLVLALVGGSPAARSAPPGGADLDERIDELLGRMTTEEKLGQLQQLDGDPITGQAREEHKELARQGRLGSLLNVRGAKNVNDIQRIAVEE